MTAVLRPLLAAFLVALAVAMSGGFARAVLPDEVLDDPALEERARELSSHLRCLVCQNQSIDDSNAELARDLRVLVRERLVAGDTNEEVIDFVVSRYGEFVLLKPRMNLRNLALWATPLVVIGAGAVFLLTRRRRRAGPGDRLSADEEARLGKILEEADRPG
ncbi:cytochrome c-type biogenesis protein [Aquibium sp. ELW1220]|jgi:cytochrome c-type biogenesis protein CcmH|uniref:cytochrome c-type biogenesis protein n=1 Tax=Aquibium sp. ELW1220 TaxID=2976766 RepID=UPI0025AF7548|nr:cytochrome c-type biogenesis protein [Aquibium sp. ELW1220]MDN2583252.1 cytochrome c-type biogenesis protein CcmH [Aquibium sp. ELW1220]